MELYAHIDAINARLTGRLSDVRGEVENLKTRVTSGLPRAEETRSWYLAFKEETQENFERVKAFGADLHSKHEHNAMRLDNHRGMIDLLRSNQDESGAITHQHTRDIGVHEDDIKRIEAMVQDLDGRLSDFSHVVAEMNVKPPEAVYPHPNIGKLDLRQQERLQTGLAFLRIAIEGLDPHNTGRNAEQVSQLYQAISCLNYLTPTKEG